MILLLISVEVSSLTRGTVMHLLSIHQCNYDQPLMPLFLHLVGLYAIPMYIIFGLLAY